MPAPHIKPEQLLQHQDWLFRLVRKLVKDDFTADDMVQATMVEALANEKAGASNLPGWLSSTAKRLVAQSWRSEYRRQEREQKVAIDDHAILHQSAEVTELFNVANRALGDLPEQERVVIMLRHMQGWKSERVAAELQIPVQQVYRDAERGCKKLKDRLESKYGREWKASCIGILGIPLGRASASTLSIALGIAASIAVVAAGLWLGGVFEGKNIPETELAGATVAGNKQPSVAQILGAGLPGAMNRSSSSSSLNLEDSYPVQVLDPDGHSVQGANVRIYFPDGLGVLSSASRNETTDDLGMALFHLPPNLKPEAVHVRADGFFFLNQYQPDFVLGEPLVVSLQQGSIPVSFQLGMPLQGVTLEIRSTDGLVGVCKTDESGMAHLSLPHPGSYQVHPLPFPYQTSPVSFHLLATGNEFAIPVPFHEVDSFTLRATDSINGETLSSAKFFLHWRNLDADGHLADVEELELQSTRGLLHYEQVNEEPIQSSIRVEVDGYQDSFVEHVGDSSVTWPVKMQEIEVVRATVVMASQRSLVSVAFHSGNASFSFPPMDSYSVSWRDQTLGDLEILDTTTFLFPRPKQSMGNRFSIAAIDDLGNHWYTNDLALADFMGPAPEFHLLPLFENTTTFQFLGGPEPDFSNIYSLDLTPTLPERNDRRLFPDPNGVVELATTLGNQWTLNLRLENLEIGLSSTPPVGAANPTYTVALPPRESSLHGTVFDSAGLPHPDARVEAKPRTDVMVHGPGTVKHHGATFILAIKGGVIHGEALFPGVYDITVTHDGFSFSQMVSTGEVFVMQAPAMAQYQLRVRDYETHVPLAASLMGPNENVEQGFPWKLSNSDSVTGHLTFRILASDSPGDFFIQAYGYELLLLSDFLFGSPQVAYLRPAQEISFSYSQLGIEADADAHWTVDSWGNDMDPRNNTIRRSTAHLTIKNAPFEPFVLIERNPDGSKTGRSIAVVNNDTFTVHSS
ncbi:MAG: hypothetical protein COA70_12810 [Planctomycetota bacterium]|nr:MAG: hypothetical protein COA70_12810 [Planctomycetota bacterium]